MNDLIEALKIFAKYTLANYPIQCEHNLLIIADVHITVVMAGDNLRLHQLGFQWSKEYDAYVSHRFGSA